MIEPYSTTNKTNNSYNIQTKANTESPARSIAYKIYKSVSKVSHNTDNKIKAPSLVDLPPEILEKIASYLDVSICFRLRSVNKLLNQTISIESLVKRYCQLNSNYNKNNYSYVSYQNFIEPFLYDASPKHKKNIDEYMNTFPENKSSESFAKFLFMQIDQLQKSDINIGLQQATFKTGATTLDLPENTIETQLSSCGQYLLTLNRNNEVILWLFKGVNGLEQLRVIETNFHGSFGFNLIDISFTAKGNAVINTRNIINLCKLNNDTSVVKTNTLLTFRLEFNIWPGSNNVVIFSSDEKFLFTITMQDNLMIGSIENDNYTLIQQINDVEYFKISNNDKLLIIIDNKQDLLFYEKNDVMNMWDFKEKIILDRLDKRGLEKITISNDCQSCYIGSMWGKLLYFKKTKETTDLENICRWIQKKYNYQYFVRKYNDLLSYFLHDPKRLLVISRHSLKPERVKYKLRLYDTQYKIFNHASLEFNHTSLNLDIDTTSFAVHPSGLTIVHVSKGYKKIQMYSIKKLSYSTMFFNFIEDISCNIGDIYYG